MKKVMIGAVMCLLVVGAVMVYAESEPINPSRITTPQIVVYGTTSASTFAGAITVAGAITQTGIPSFNAALTANGTLTNGPLNTLPLTGSTNSVWLTFKGNGTTYVVRAYAQ